MVSLALGLAFLSFLASVVSDICVFFAYFCILFGSFLFALA
jgi:hypothetical protein